MSRSQLTPDATSEGSGLFLYQHWLVLDVPTQGTIWGDGRKGLRTKQHRQDTKRRPDGTQARRARLRLPHSTGCRSKRTAKSVREGRCKPGPPQTNQARWPPHRGAPRSQPRWRARRDGTRAWARRPAEAQHMAWHHLPRRRGETPLAQLPGHLCHTTPLKGATWRTGKPGWRELAEEKTWGSRGMGAGPETGLRPL